MSFSSTPHLSAPFCNTPVNLCAIGRDTAIRSLFQPWEWVFLGYSTSAPGAGPKLFLLSVVPVFLEVYFTPELLVPCY